MADRRSAFIERLMPYAIQASQATGIDPRIITAQSAIETGWGRSTPGNNYFGIKSHGQSGGNRLATTEVVNGRPVRTTDSFRTYDSPAASAGDYADFINRNPRYQEFRTAQGLEAQTAALQKSGYATDPNYGQKVLGIARGVTLTSTPLQPGSAAPALPPATEVATLPQAYYPGPPVPLQGAASPAAEGATAAPAQQQPGIIETAKEKGWAAGLDQALGDEKFMAGLGQLADAFGGGEQAAPQQRAPVPMLPAEPDDSAQRMAAAQPMMAALLAKRRGQVPGLTLTSRGGVV